MNSLDLHRDFYNKYAAEYEEQTKGYQLTQELENFLSMIPKNGTVLDAGCAYGRDCKMIAEYGCKTLGIDISDVLIQRAKEHVPNAEFLVGDITSLPFDDASIDGIWCCAVLLHFAKKDISVVLQEFYRVLKLGGFLYVLVKKGEGEGVVQDERYNGAEKYYSFFTENEMITFLEDAGFTLIETESKDAIAYDLGEPMSFYVRK